MRIRNRSYLFIINSKKYHDQMICRTCGKHLGLGELIYSKRKQKYYCSKCTVKYGHLPKRKIEQFIEVKSK